MEIIHHGAANVSPIPVTWTLCIEEHFYILWGIILYFSKVKNVIFWIVILIATAIASRIVFDSQGWLFRDILTNFDYFMYGAIPAWCFVCYRDQTIERIQRISTIFKSLIIVLAIGYILWSPHIIFAGKQHVEPLLLGAFFMLLLFILLPQQNRFKIGENNLFSRLGLYTYGVYLFHVIVINLVRQLYLKSSVVLSESIVFLLIFTTSAMLTIVVAIASYHLYEKPFIKIKPKY